MFAKNSSRFILIPFIIVLFFIGLFLFYTSYLLLFGIAIFLFLTIGFAIFFRDPERKIGNGIVAPADGIIQDIKIENDFIIIITFMNLYDVHVNRAPIDCKVKKVERLRGTYAPAYKKEASENEKVITILNTKIGELRIVQIAGILARRIVSYIKKGETLTKGQRIGMIRFGSRVDLYLPKDKVKLCVSKNIKVKAGMTTVAEVINEMG